jgi:DnaJ-class molecular chaperone
MKNEDLKVLQFIYDRLERVHEENINYDYMLSLKNIIERERDQLSLGTVVQAKPEVCQSCKGKGYVFFTIHRITCSTCNGTGKLSC